MVKPIASDGYHANIENKTSSSFWFSHIYMDNDTQFKTQQQITSHTNANICENRCEEKLATS